MNSPFYRPESGSSRFSFPCRTALATMAGALLLAPESPGQFTFTDRTNLLSNSGFGANECNSGVAIGVVDMNGDGKDDIVRLHGADLLSIETQTTANAPFGHNVKGDVGDNPWALCVADVDRNGINDLLLAPFGGGMTLYTADGTGASHAASQLPNSTNIDCQGTLFGDLNNDGHIDIFTCHDTADNRKFENDGAGVFSDRPSLMNTNLGNNSAGNYAAMWTDYDNDGTLDLYLSKCRQGNANPADPERINRLFKNNGISTAYADTAPGLGLADGSQSWCADFADIDNDGDLDVFILNHPEGGSNPSKLMLNQNGSYINFTTASLLQPHLSGFDGIQALFDDFDNDTLVDLVISTTGSSGGYRFFRNIGGGRFTRVNNAFVIGGTTGGAGVPLNYMQSFGVGDLNHDGFLDIYVGRGTGFASPSNESDVLFMNNGNANNFLAVQLEGVLSNRNAIGARVEIAGPWGVQVREIRSGEGYGIQNSLSAHFGLGTATIVDRVTVRWPTGFTDELTNVPANQFITITETVEPGDFTTPVITSSLSENAVIAGNFRYRIAALNFPQSFSIANAPAGMTVDALGNVSWTPQTIGFFTFNITATNPAGSDTETVSVQVAANPALALLPAIEAVGFAANVDSENPWVSQNTVTFDNIDAIRSGDIGNGGQSWFEVTVEGPGTGSFRWRVSSEEDFDLLSWSVNGAPQGEISGTTGWEQRAFNVPEGPQTIRWTYSKDGSVSEGMDAGYVDTFSYTPDTPPDLDGDGLADAWEQMFFGHLNQNGTTDFDGDGRTDLAEQAAGTDPTDPGSRFEVTKIEALADTGGYRIEWTSTPGVSYVVQGSEDAVAWTDVTGVIVGAGDVTERAVFPADSTFNDITLVPAGADCFAVVPPSNLYADTWQGGDEAGFAARGGTAAWTQGQTGVGYERSANDTYDLFLEINFEALLYNRNETVYIRVPFEVASAALVTSMELAMRYDDGFVAYLNGVEIASENAPASPTWNSGATDIHDDSDAISFLPFDVSQSLDALVDGQNILAIHGLNRQVNSSDMLIEPRLTGMQVVSSGAPAHHWRVVVLEQ